MSILKRKYKTLNLIKVSRSALFNNFHYFQSLNPQAKICPVLKSNAYGHGLGLVGRLVDREIRPEFICVDSLYEAYALKKAGISTPILIMGYTFPQNFKYKKLSFRIPVFDKETLEVLNKFQPGIKVHIKIDSGMNRLGIKENQVDDFIDSLAHCRNIEIEGIYSHLADADNPDELFCLEQINRFKKIIKKFEEAGFRFKYKHLNATTGSLRFPDPEFNLVRLGIGFYGLSPFSHKGIRKLKPSLKLITHLVSIKEIMKGETVSYGRTFKAKSKMKIAILPLGYYDGIDRRLSNKGFVRVGRRFCPIIGNVCMNITIIDVSNVKNAKVGEEAVVFDNQIDSPNSIQNIAKLINTIPYEVLTNLSETTRRVLVTSHPPCDTARHLRA